MVYSASVGAFPAGFGETDMRRSILPPVLLFLLALVAPAAAEVPSAVARAVCHDHREMARQLRNTYEEAPISLGLQSNGNLLQVFVSKRTGTWTILSVSPGGLGCILAVGKSWETLDLAAMAPET